MNLGNITMGEFMDHFENEYNLEISMLSYGVSILYSFFANKKKIEERRGMKMSLVANSEPSAVRTSGGNLAFITR